MKEDGFQNRFAVTRRLVFAFGFYGRQPEICTLAQKKGVILATCWYEQNLSLIWAVN